MNDLIECPYCHRKFPYDGDKNTTTFWEHFLFGQDMEHPYISHGKWMINEIKKYVDVPREKWPDWLEAIFLYHGL